MSRAPHPAGSAGPGLQTTRDNVAAAVRGTLWVDGAGRVKTIDQTRLPFEWVEIELGSLEDCARAIQTMQVRGAPLIGVVGAYGLALALAESARAGAGPSVPAEPDVPAASDRSVAPVLHPEVALQTAYDRLYATRPTAVNLRWALDRVRAAAQSSPGGRQSVECGAWAERAWAEAEAIRTEDIACNRAIGEQALVALAPLIERAQQHQRPLQLLTHCNAGALAAVAYGTALAPMFLLRERGIAVHVWVDETRPRNQGASLTAWELGQAGIAHTVVADNAGGLLMMQGRVDAVIVGTDRVTANGDVCNKIGTYLKALAARAHDVPFLVACPCSTIDLALADGSQVPIEERSGREVSHLRGIDEYGRIAEFRVIPEGSSVANPAFDITPAALVSALVTERGVCAARPDAIAALMARHG